MRHFKPYWLFVVIVIGLVVAGCTSPNTAADEAAILQALHVIETGTGPQVMRYVTNPFTVSLTIIIEDEKISLEDKVTHDDLLNHSSEPADFSCPDGYVCSVSMGDTVIDVKGASATSIETTTMTMDDGVTPVTVKGNNKVTWRKASGAWKATRMDMVLEAAAK